MKKYIISILVMIVLVGGYIYIRSIYNLPPFCPDSYGYGNYIYKENFLNKIKTVKNYTEFRTLLDNELYKDAIAFETYACGNVKYYIREGIKFNSVNKIDFDNYINSKLTEIIKIHQSGNSPYFINDLSTKKNYSIGDKDGKYTLIEDNY